MKKLTQVNRMRLLLAGLLLCLVFPAHAANPRYNCTTSCTFVADLAAGYTWTSCKLYSSGVFKASSPVVTVSGGIQCQDAATFAAGVGYSVTISGVDSTGQESPQSAPVVFDSAVPLSAPTNLRILGTAF